MPARLRPTAPIAADAILVGDPGRALMLAQALLGQPKMSNHARGLWGYWGETAGGEELTVQSTGMGGPSAGLVVADLAELGVRRAIRVGTCTALAAGLRPAELVAIEGAWPAGDAAPSEPIPPDPELSAALAGALGAEARAGTVLSLDTLHGGGAPAPRTGAAVADMQTATVFERARALGLAAAAVLVVTESVGGERVGEEDEGRAATVAGTAAVSAFSNPLLEA